VAAATTTDGAATDAAAAGSAGTVAATTDSAAQIADIDWGAAMPALIAKAQSLGIKDGVIAKFGNDIDGLLRSIDERETQVGELSGYKGAFNNLANAGVIIQELQALRSGDIQTLNSLLAARLGPRAAAALTPAAPAANGNGQPAVAWKGEYLASRDAEGKPIFNRAALARDGLTEAQATQLHAGWNDQLADIFRGPETFEERIAKIVEARVSQATQQTEQKLTAAQQQALQAQQQDQQAQQQALAAAAAQKAEQDAAIAWGNTPENANLLYVNKKNVSAGVTKFHQEMQAYINSGAVNPYLPHAQQLEVAKQHVLAINRPAAAAVPTPSDKAKRQPAAGAQAVKLTPEQFHEKYKHLYADQSRDATGLAEWINYEATGQVPELARR
jgi:hypothetical protein